MTVKLRRLWLDSVGDPSARFADVRLDFTDAASNPLDTIVWLRNGGGKTSLLALMFSLMLPHQKDFLGGRDQDRSLADYVQGGDTSHVVAEWDTPYGVVVTGAVYEWPDRKRPGEPSKHQGDLTKRWYVGRADRGVSLETLPIKMDGKRATAEQFTTALRNIAKANPGAVQIASTQADWKRALDSFDIDQAVFGYQKSMNRGEGSIDELFKFPTPEQFVDFIIDLVIDDEEPDSFSTRLRKVATKVAARPRFELERDFCGGAADRLVPVGAGWAQHQRTVERLGSLSEQAWTLQRRLALSATDAQERSASAEAARAAAATERNSINTARRTAMARASEARRVAAQHWVVDAGKTLTGVGRQIGDVEREVGAWDLLEVVLDHATIVDQLADVDIAMAAVAEGAEPQRERRNRAAAALRSRYDALLERLGQQQAEAEAERIQASERVLEAESERVEAASEQRRAELASHGAQQELDRVEGATADAVARGDLTAGDGPADVVERVGGRVTALEVEDGRLATRLGEVDEELTRLDTERSDLHPERADAKQRLRTATELTERIRAEADTLAAEDRVRVLAQTEQVSIWAAGEAVLRKLLEADKAASRALVDLEVDAQRDLRNRTALGDDGLLPPADDVVAIMGVLAQASIPATSGLTYLSTSIKRKRWDETIASHPGLLSGVLVEAADLERARSAVIEAGLHPASLVTVAAKSDVQSREGESTFVVPPSPALFDQQAAAEERTRLDRVLADYTQRRETIENERTADHRLHAQLQQFLVNYPAGSLEKAGANADRAREELDDIDERETRITEERQLLIDEQRAGNARRGQIADERATLKGLIGRLTTLARDFADQATVRETLERETTAAKAAGDSALAAERRRGELERQADGAKERLRDLTEESKEMRSQRGAVTFAGEWEEEVSDPGDRPLEALRSAFESAHQVYEQQVNDVVLTARRTELVQKKTAAEAQLPDAGSAERVEAEALQSHPEGATAESRRRQRGSLQVRLRELERLKTRATDDQEAATTEVAEVGTPEGLLGEETPATRAAAVVLQTEEEEHAAKLRVEEAELDKQVGELKATSETAANRAHTFELLCSGLVNLVGEPPATLVVVELYDGSDSAASAEVGELTDRLRAAKDQAKTARETVETAAQQLTGFCTRSEYTSLVGIADGAVLGTLEALGPRANELAEQLRARVVVLNAELASIDTDRQILITDLMTQVKSVLDLLARAGRTLVMPEKLEGWAGLSFVSITFDRGDDDTELRRLLGEEIDHIVAAGNVPEGLVCLKRAVHAAVPKGFRATVLKPSAELVPQRHPITKMGGWSGGEKLTAAVLLYCTLARLRAGRRRQTLTDAGAGVLVLDNPLGKASYVGFVALQRRVAAELGVQLVYTTAVRDLGAVGKFPNVVRCRNVSPPGRARSYVDVVERVGAAHGTEIEGAVSAVRVLRTDDETSSTNGDGAEPHTTVTT